MNVKANPIWLALVMCLAWAFLCCPSNAEVIELEGTVKAVDPDARTISVERKTAKGTKTLDLEVHKKAGDLSSLKVGDEISFSYDPDLELVTKSGEASPSASAQPVDRPLSESHQKRPEVNLLAGVNVADGRVSGKWMLKPNGDLVGTGNAGEDIPRFTFSNKEATDLAQADYDLAMQFTVKSGQSGFSDVIPILPGVPAVLCFRNEKGGGTAKVFFFGGEAAGATKSLPSRFQPNRKYTAVISLRSNGTEVKTTLDGNTVLEMSNFANKDVQTNFAITVSPGSELTLSRYVVTSPQPQQQR